MSEHLKFLILCSALVSTMTSTCRCTIIKVLFPPPLLCRTHTYSLYFSLSLQRSCSSYTRRKQGGNSLPRNVRICEFLSLSLPSCLPPRTHTCMCTHPCMYMCTIYLNTTHIYMYMYTLYYSVSQANITNDGQTNVTKLHRPRA